MDIKEKSLKYIAILSLLKIEATRDEIKNIFGISDDEFELIIFEASNEYLLDGNTGKYNFECKEYGRQVSEIAGEELIPAIYFLWKQKGLSREVYSDTEDLIIPAILKGVAQFIIIMLEMGRYAEEKKDTDFALEIYKLTALEAKNIDIQIRKTLLVKTVLKLSKLEFMRGISPVTTLELQREAIKLITQSNITAEDALLYLYAGVGEHFSGEADRGETLRCKGIKYLKEFNYMELEEEAIPLMVWHYYLVGDFKRVIGYYESYLIAIENRKNAKIIAFAYPPVIFSYFFVGEFNKALILGENIQKSAMANGDKPAANLMYAIMGRTYIYIGDMEAAEKILYNSYAEATELNYGWGLYYSLFGICFYQFKKGNMTSSRNAMFLASEAAREHGFISINASPFLLDVMKIIDEEGLEPVQGFDYRSKLKEYLSSNNVHLAGVANRHIALIKKKEKQARTSIIASLKKSIELLELSGNMSELAQSYTEISLVYDGSSNNDAAKYANMAWKLLNKKEKNDFPHTLRRYIEAEDEKDAFSTALETTWLELRSIINEERLCTRLVTSMCRLLDVESGAIATITDGKAEIRIAQNMDAIRKKEFERQIFLGETANAIKMKKISVTYNNEKRQSFSGKVPRFSLILPFFEKNDLTAVLLMESYYYKEPFSKEELGLLEKFSARMGSTIYNAVNYNLIVEHGMSVDAESEFAEKMSVRKSYCPSVNEDVEFIMDQITKVAKTNIPVLITGETGVGKEVFARELFEQSEYKKTFIKVNCGAIPENLVESELFGYEKGSFTGAAQRKKGYFELAEGGTIFLDEIGELSLSAQVKLLRVLQEHELMRIGGTEAVKVNFRLVAATNKWLKDEVEKGNFRKDLFYRLNVVQFLIPPLRKRKQDIPNLAHFFIAKYCEEMGKPICDIDTKTFFDMLKYDWPGNIRELENELQRAIVFSENGIVRIDFSTKLGNKETVDGKGEPHRSYDNYITVNKDGANLDGKERIGTEEELVTLFKMEKSYIEKVLAYCNGKVSGKNGAAEILGVKRTTLISKMKKLGIDSKYR